MSAREHLIAAAKELLWERGGYETMSSRAVQVKSGAGQGSFYHHFASKAERTTGALDEVATEMRETLRTVLHTDKPPLERIKDFLAQPQEALPGCRMGRMTQEEIVSQEPLHHPISSYFLYAEQAIAATLEKAQSEGTLGASVHTSDLAATLIAAVQGGYVLIRALQGPQQMDLALRGALTLLEGIAQK